MKFVQLALRVIAVLSFSIAIVWMIVAPGFEPLSVALGGIASLITSFVIDRSQENTESLDQHNRRVMLNHVENFWVKGILEKSLHGVALLELGIKEDVTSVDYPWTIKKQATNETILAGKSMLQIFNEVGLSRSLLILGTPGSGKTTMLLELTRQLIEVARQDGTEPIPVVFNLASWRENQILADWLSEQLNSLYYVPKKTAQKLVTDNKMFLLLDGLDEVKQDLREKCVEAINEFKNAHGLNSLVVCSRIEEYQAINKKLSLAGAINLQPLTSGQVDTYFNKFGKNLSSLRQILRKDKTLQELTETPLMLSIMVLAYKDVNIKEIPELKNNKEQRKYLFDTYINRMFERLTRSEKKDFSKEETHHYLSWLAYQMVKHNLIAYQIEGMQPSWLDNEKQQRIYKWIVWLSVGLIAGLSIGLILGLILGLREGLTAGLIGGLSVGWVNQMAGKVSNENEIEMVDKLRWSWRSIEANTLKTMLSMLIGGLIVVLIVVLIVGLRVVLNIAVNIGLSGMLSGTLSIFLLGVLAAGLSSEQIDETNYPGQRLKQTLYSATLLILIGGLMVGLVFGLISQLSDGLISQLSDGLIGGLILGVILGLRFGALALIQHYALKFLLVKKGSLPRRLIPFLEYCVDLIFLRRMGGSYVFVHRLLMEHFAEMEVEKL